MLYLAVSLGFRITKDLERFVLGCSGEGKVAGVRKYKRDRRASKTARGGERAPSTVNRELELLSKVFSLAIDQGLSISNPCRKVKRFREDNERNRYLSDQEEARLLSVLTGPRADLRPVVILAIHTGMRRGELLSLRWANVDFERGLFT